MAKRSIKPKKRMIGRAKMAKTFDRNVAVYEVKDARVKVETDKALLIEAAEFEDDQWVPKSQITDESEVWEAGQEGSLIVTEWIAVQKGWL